MLVKLVKIPLREILGTKEMKKYAHPAWARDSETYVPIPDPPPHPR